ncbi:MAG: ABC transporter ATP-binding protein/permease, partial [Rectinema sp.]|nr:ABC transporter ATP-binding protein/permease [Rectinema sp.]
GSIILMVVTSKTLALAIMPLFVAAGLVIWFFSTRLEPLFRAVQQRLDRLNTVLQENIAGVRLIRSFAQTARESRRFHDANDALAEGNEVVMRRMAIMNPLLTLLINIGIVLIVWVGGNHAIEESASASLSLGQIVAFSNYLMATLHPVLLMIQLSNTWANGLASAARINEVLDTIPAVQESNEAFPLPDSAQGKVEFNHVSFHYHGKTDGAVLEDICALVKPGMPVAILGATGSGKSSLVNLVPRFYDPSEGSVLVDGADVRTLKLSSLRGHIALVPQETILFSGSVRENLKFGNPQASEDDMIVAAKAAQAHDFITRLPQGYDTHIEERGVNLSGGQKQRIAIARALLCKPKILILDDGTSAVDVETETHIHSAIASWTKGLTVLLVAQRVSTVLNADHIIVLDEGRIVGEGTHRQLYAHNPV